MKFIKLTYHDDSVVYVRVSDIELIAPTSDGGSKIIVAGQLAYIKEFPEQLFGTKAYTFND